MRVQNYEEKGKRQNILRKICKYRNKFVSLQGQNMSFGYPGRIPRGVRLYRYCPILKAVIRQLFFIFFSEFSGWGQLAEMHIYAVFGCINIQKVLGRRVCFLPAALHE